MNVDLSCTTPLDPFLWEGLLNNYMEDASEHQQQAVMESGLLYWPFMLNRNGRLEPTWFGESSTGRIYSRTPPVQGVPKPLRKAIQEPGKVVLTVDWRASHIHIIAQATNTTIEEDPYSGWGYQRDKVKVAILALLNGAGDSRVNQILGVQNARQGTLGPGVGENTTPGNLRAQMANRWPKFGGFLDDLRTQVKETGKVSTRLGDLVVPSPDKAPAYWLQAEEAYNLRRVLSETPPEGLELILPLHDETVWLTTPEDVYAHSRWVQTLMGRYAPCRARWGSSWGDLDDGKVGRDRPVSIASILYSIGKSVKEDPIKALQEQEIGIQLLGAHDPDRLTSIAAVLEVGGTQSVVKAIRSLGKQGRKSLSRAKIMATASAQEVEDIGLPLFKKGDQLELGQHLAKSMDVAVGTAEGVRVYVSDIGAWRLLDSRDLESKALLYGRAFVEGKGGNAPSPVFLSAAAVAGIAKIAELELFDPVWKPAEGFVAFGNGALDEDGILHPHDAENRILMEHMFCGDYEEDAKAPTWQGYLEGVFEGDDDAEEKISFLQEYIGACLFGRATYYQRHPMLWGPSASNGKSVLIKTIREIFPPGSLASSPPQAWSKEFGKSALLHARMNLITETPDRDIVDSGPVKAIMTGDPLEINIKYRDPITYAPVSGHIFAANALPKVTDRSDGFFRRFVMIKFNRSFKDGVDADTSLPDKLKLEIPGIIAWAVRGYLRLKTRGHLVPPRSHDDAIMTWKEESSSELSFISEKIEEETEAGKMMTSQAIYNAYRIYCSDQGLYPVSQNKLGRSIKEAGYQMYRGKQGRGFIVRLKDFKTPAHKKV